MNDTIGELIILVILSISILVYANIITEYLCGNIEENDAKEIDEIALKS
jgi:hypothetical protein